MAKARGGRDREAVRSPAGAVTRADSLVRRRCFVRSVTRGAVARCGSSGGHIRQVSNERFASKKLTLSMSDRDFDDLPRRGRGRNHAEWD